MPDEPKPDRIDLDRARNLLGLLWMIGGGLLVVLVIGQSILGRFDGLAQEFWAWFTPTIFPTLGLIIGVIGSTALEDDSGRTVKRFFFIASVALSILYLVALMGTLLGEPFAGSHDMKYYNQSNYWLSPIQGLAVAAIAALFNSRKKTDLPEPAKPPSAPGRLTP
ncbi:MAG: hypothetical protein ABJB69_08905 [Spartobacteria bacterium]